MRASTLLAVLGLSLLTQSCDEEDYKGDSRERGDLGRGRFDYQCINDTDSACLDRSVATLPLAVAVGGRFDMLFQVSSGAQPIVIGPAAEFVRRADRGFEVLKPGEFALLAVTGNSEVIDLKHLRAANISEVRVQVNGQLPGLRLNLEVGQTVSLQAVPFDSTGVQLGGALAYAWRSSDTTRLTVESLPQLSRVTVRGAGPGRTTLVAQLAGKEFPVEVLVGGSEFDAGLDAGFRYDAGFSYDSGLMETPDGRVLDEPDGNVPDGGAGNVTTDGGVQ